MKAFLYGAFGAALILQAPSQTLAADHSHHNHHNHGLAVQGHDHSLHVDEPVSIMGGHMHGAGEWMLSYRYQRMAMGATRDGTDNLSRADILALPNPNGSMPANLRVVPTDMTMDMHMIGGMYGVTDWLTLMAMGMYMHNEMDHESYQAMSGAFLGTFTTESSGWGDSSAAALIRLYHNDTHHIHLNLGISAPTGSIDEEDDVLTPLDTRMTMRLPYAMQLGSGTWDARPGLTYTGQQAGWGWGVQYAAIIRLEDENDEGYALGDKHALHSWIGRRFHPGFEGTLRLSAETLGDIDGRDPQITAPVQTADPGNYGGERLELGVGLSYEPDNLGRFGFEVSAPLYQDLNGPQMEQDIAITTGWRYKF